MFQIRRSLTKVERYKRDFFYTPSIALTLSPAASLATIE